MPLGELICTLPVAPALMLVNAKGTVPFEFKLTVLPSPAVIAPVTVSNPLGNALMLKVPLPAGSPVTGPFIMVKRPSMNISLTPLIAPVVTCERVHRKQVNTLKVPALTVPVFSTAVDNTKTVPVASTLPVVMVLLRESSVRPATVVLPVVIAPVASPTLLVLKRLDVACTVPARATAPILPSVMPPWKLFIVTPPASMFLVITVPKRPLLPDVIVKLDGRLTAPTSPTFTAAFAPLFDAPADKVMAPPPSSAAPPRIDPVLAVTDRPPVAPILAAPSVMSPEFEVKLNAPFAN